MSATGPGSRPAAPARAYFALAVAVVGVSHGAIFVRLSASEPLATAAWRVGLAAFVMVPAALLFGRARFSASLRDWCLAVVAGGLLALHFAAWITSLSYTSIANSVLLVDTTPVFVGLISLFVGREPPRRRMWAAILLSLAGAAIIATGSAAVGGGALVGDLLAVAGAACMAGNLLLAREAQRALPLLPYLATAYASAAVVLWIAVLVTGTRYYGFGPVTWAALGGMALVSQLIGHSGYNYSLRHLPPAFVAVTLLAEPVIASLLGWFAFGEAVTTRTLLGGAFVLAAIAVAASGDRTAR